MKNSFALVLFSLALLSYHKGGSQSCNDVKNGTFYSYPKNSAEQWKIVREGSSRYNAGETEASFYIALQL